MRSTNSSKISLFSGGELNGGIFTCVLLPLQTLKNLNVWLRVNGLSLYRFLLANNCKCLFLAKHVLGVLFVIKEEMYMHVSQMNTYLHNHSSKQPWVLNPLSFVSVTVLFWYDLLLMKMKNSASGNRRTFFSSETLLHQHTEV